jgi:hypothetical protein
VWAKIVVCERAMRGCGLDAGLGQMWELFRLLSLVNVRLSVCLLPTLGSGVQASVNSRSFPPWRRCIECTFVRVVFDFV